MSFQNPNAFRNPYQNDILDLEKKYFKLLDEMIRSDEFIGDLLLIEKEVRENYPEYRDIWKIKNKIKVPVERLIRHHVYMRFNSLIKGIYPSPVSSDLGIRTDDAVICIDAKTIDTNSNAGDLRSTHVEENQNSFDNKNYEYIKTKSHLKSIDHYSRLPVLTFIIKVVYRDDNYRFTLERISYPSIVLVCIPNGEISSLFDFNIIDNFKTYNYYNERDDIHFKPIPMPIITDGKSKDDVLNKILKILDEECIEKRHFTRLPIQKFNKIAYFDSTKMVIWWKTSVGGKDCLAAVKSGSSVRFNNEYLSNRYDSKNNPWCGYHEYQLPDQL